MTIVAEMSTQVSIEPPMNTLTETAMTRMSRALGPAKGKALAESVMKRMGLAYLVTPQDLCDFANYLVVFGGVAEAVGRSLKVMALLRGAVDRPIPTHRL